MVGNARITAMGGQGRNIGCGCGLHSWAGAASLLAACVAAGLMAAPATAQRAERPTLDITGYVIDAELDPAAHHLTAKAVVSFTAPANLEVVNFGFHPALKVTRITDESGKLLEAEVIRYPVN